MITRRSFCASMMLLPSAALPASPLLTRRTPPFKAPLDFLSYWKMDEASGNRADQKGGRTLTDSSVGNAAGKFGNAAYFNGLNQYLTSTDSTLKAVQNPFTWSFWVYLQSAVNYGGVDYDPLITNGVTGDYAGMEFAYYPAGNSVYLALTKSGDDYNAVFGDAIAIQTWVHIVGSRSNTELAMWTNGHQKIEPITHTGHMASAQTYTYFGTRSDDFNLRCNARLDQALFYDRVLSGPEVSWLYNSGAGREF